MNVCVLIDGGHVRVLARQAGRLFNPDLIERLAHRVVGQGEQLFRALYYDCAPFNGQVKAPVSGRTIEFNQSDRWLLSLSKRPLIAVRRGVLKFKGFKPKRTPVGKQGLTDDDFRPDFEQKGVDMRIGLDMALLAERRAVGRIVLMTNDTDCVPAMKHVRRSGLQIALARFPDCSLAPELLTHADFVRDLTWP